MHCVLPGRRRQPNKQAIEMIYNRKYLTKQKLMVNNIKLGLILTQSGLSMTRKWGEVSSPEMGGQVPQGGEGSLYIGEEDTEKRKWGASFRKFLGGAGSSNQKNKKCQLWER